MVEAESVRRLALALPETTDESEGARLSFKVAGKGFAWTFMRREAPKRPRAPDPSVLAIRCELPRKELLIEAAPDRFFDDPHYLGFPAVLARLARLDEPELAQLLAAAWRLQAPRKLAKAHP